MQNIREGYITTAALASQLGISRISVFHRIKKGLIKAERLGRAYLIPLSEAKIRNTESDQVATSRGGVVIYRESANKAGVEFRLNNNNLWLSVSELSKLYNRAEKNIRANLSVLIKDGTLSGTACVNEFINDDAQPDECFSLEAVIALGFRLRSKGASRFRAWALKMMSDFLRRGYAINEHELASDRKKAEEFSRVAAVVGRHIK